MGSVQNAMQQLAARQNAPPLESWQRTQRLVRQLDERTSLVEDIHDEVESLRNQLHSQVSALPTTEDFSELRVRNGTAQNLKSGRPTK